MDHGRFPDTGDEAIDFLDILSRNYLRLLLPRLWRR
jgi:hypothetical protein